MALLGGKVGESEREVVTSHRGESRKRLDRFSIDGVLDGF